MAKAKSGLVKGDYVSAPAKKTRQGHGKNTKYTATSRNGAKKMYRGQGKQIKLCIVYYGVFDC